MTRYQKAKQYKAWHSRTNARLDGVLAGIADKLPMCGNGPKHNWSTMLADLFWPSNSCGCCFFYRGVGLGLVSGFVLGFVI